MPWWFWIITHVWILSVGVIGTVYIIEEHWKIGWGEIIGGIVLHIFAPIIIILALFAGLLESVIKPKVLKWIKHSGLEKFFEDRKRKKREKRRQMERERRVKEESDRDFKEMEDNEDEWRIERLGIKLR